MTVRSTAATELATDVLVVGGGLAALRAAWSARQAGARVLVVVKRKLGQSGSSANTSGGFAAASPISIPPTTRASTTRTPSSAAGSSTSAPWPAPSPRRRRRGFAS